MALHHCRRLAEAHGLSGRPRATHAVAFLSGAGAGAAGTVASYPFDLLRTTLAAQGEPKVYASMTDAARGIVRASGVAGLYRGLGITVLEIMPYAALQFGLYDIFMGMSTRAWVSGSGGLGGGGGGGGGTRRGRLGHPRHAGAGHSAVAERVGRRHELESASCGYPPAGDSSGGWPSLTLPSPPPPLCHFTNPQEEAHPGEDAGGARGNSGARAFLCGLAAGTLAKLGTHPLDVAKKRFQVAGLQRSARYGRRVPAEAATSLSRCLAEIHAREGFAGLYKGALPSIMKAAPAAAVTFAAYDIVLKLLAARDAAAAEAAGGSGTKPRQRPPMH